MRTPLKIDKNSAWQLQKALKDDYDQKVKLKIRALLLIAKGSLSAPLSSLTFIIFYNIDHCFNIIQRNIIKKVI